MLESKKAETLHDPPYESNQGHLMAKIGRNDPCPCGSGKKYKKCCLSKGDFVQDPPKIMTASGEEASFRQAHYDLMDKNEAVNLLNQASDFEVDESDLSSPGEISYAWLETGESAKLVKTIKGIKPASNPLLPNLGADGPLRLLGDIKIKGGKLLFNTMGEQRFALGKKRLESLLSGLVKHRLDSVQSMASALRERSRDRRVETLLSNAAEHYDFDPDDPKFTPLKPGQSLQDALHEREFSNIDEVNFFMQRAMADYNNQPQEDLGGLSPLQVSKIMNCDWLDHDGPIRLNKSLGREELKETPLLHNTLLLLRHTQQEGGIKTTEAGYLSPGLVREMLSEMKWPKRWVVFHETKAKGRLREMSIPHLYSLRLICRFSGLLKKRGNSFKLTSAGREILTEEYAGRLYKRLFFTQFQRLNLNLYDRRGLEYPAIQKGIGFSLYQLSLLATDVWYSLADVASRLLLPAVKRAITSNEDHRDWNELQIRGVVQNLGYRLIEPLEVFGLLKTRDLDKPLLELSPATEFRLTQLYKRFISFKL